MVTINFRLSQVSPQQVKLTKAIRLVELLERCENVDWQKGDYIAVRQGRVITDGELVNDNDVLDIFPALSGG